MGSLARFLQLPLSGKFCFLQAFTLLPVAAVAMRLGGLQRAQALLARPAPRAPGSDADRAAMLERANTVARLVRAAARRSPARPTCLHRSVVLWWLLRRRGIASELRIGSRLRNDKFEAHAWVECAGEALNDSDDVHERFVPFDRPIVPQGAPQR